MYRSALDATKSMLKSLDVLVFLRVNLNAFEILLYCQIKKQLRTR